MCRSNVIPVTLPTHVRTITRFSPGGSATRRSIGKECASRSLTTRRSSTQTFACTGRRVTSGSADQIHEDIDVFSRLGVSELIFDFRSESLAQSLERMERFAKDLGLGRA